MILLKIFSVPLTWISFPFYISITTRFGLFIVFPVSWMFCARSFLGVTFFCLVWGIHFFYFVWNDWDSFFLYSVSESCFWGSCWNFKFPDFLWFGFSLFVLFLLAGHEQFYLFSSTVCLCFHEFLKGNINFLFKAILRSLSCASAMLNFSGPTVIR